MYDSIIVSSLLSLLPSPFLVLNTLDRRSATGDILYNSNGRNGCFYLTCVVLVPVTLFLSLFFLIHFWGDRKRFVEYIQSEIWGVLSTGIYCVFSQCPFRFNRHEV